MDGIQIRDYQAEDEASVHRLRRAVYGTTAAIDADFHWRHFGHPTARSMMQVAVAGKEVIGIRPVELFDFAFAHQAIKGAVLSGVMVRDDYRRQGVFSKLVAASEQVAWRNDASFVMTMPNDTSVLGFRRNGYTDLGCRTPLIAMPFGRSTKRATNEGPMACTLSTVDVPGEGYDELEQKIRSIHSGFHLRRTQDWVTWRYSSSPSLRYRLTEARDQSGSLRAFCVTRTEKRKGLNLGYIIDLMGDDTAATEQALVTALANLRKTPSLIGILSVVSGQTLINILRRAGCLAVTPRLFPKKFHTVCRPNPDGRLQASGYESLNNWYLTLGDWDNI